MMISSKGDLKACNLIDDVYHCATLDEALISGPKLCDKGMWLIFPPTNYADNLGCLVVDARGNVEMVADAELNAYTPKGSYRIQLPDIRAGNYRKTC
jgi:hypothetical protein